MNILITSNFKKYYRTYIDFVDHYWINYFEKRNYVFYQLPNSKKISNKILGTINNIDLIILPGGNDVFEKDKYSNVRMEIEKNTIFFGLKKNIPILGVCRGMQIINNFFDGKIHRINGHMKKKHNIYMKTNIFGKSKFIVNSYHNYGIKHISKSKKFNTLATDKNNNIEMFKHKKKEIYGVMWHPERTNNFSMLDKIIKLLLKE
mgnify:FL=1